MQFVSVNVVENCVADTIVFLYLQGFKTLVYAIPKLRTLVQSHSALYQVAVSKIAKSQKQNLSRVETYLRSNTYRKADILYRFIT